MSHEEVDKLFSVFNEPNGILPQRKRASAYSSSNASLREVAEPKTSSIYETLTSSSTYTPISIYKDEEEAVKHRLVDTSAAVSTLEPAHSKTVFPDATPPAATIAVSATSENALAVGRTVTSYDSERNDSFQTEEKDTTALPTEKLVPAGSQGGFEGDLLSQSVESLKEKSGLIEDVTIVKYKGDDNCIFECVRPSNYQPSLEVSQHPEAAKTYPFKLDAFQENSIRCLERGESVLVSAHTSAGKTVVAEYAIAMSIRDKQRVIYTSPIKALSNQKYRDLSDEFSDVGLMTGDVTLHPNSSIMVMTTEILRSMLYRGSTLIREVKWVIFDEIHYLRDRERGVVWEECIILLPKEVRLVFLSATIPNAIEFAEWICRLKHQPCNVIYTDFRPIPLHHFVFPAGGDGVHLVMDEKKNFKIENLQKAIASLGGHITNASMQTAQAKKKNKSRNKDDIEKIIQLCHVRKYTPVIVFSFSKATCERNATHMEKIDLMDEQEKESIEEIFNNAVATLSEEDKNLPQVVSMLPLLKRGIGIHHGGLLPLLKEIIEILFQESLLRVLFSTETFSLGINMPAKTVVFSSVRKWDGKEYRILNSGEYIQMAGRAGRRGLDDRGLTIVMLDEQVDPEDAKNIFTGEALRLDSQFHLGYNMLLNLLRAEGADPEDMIQHSFFQFQTNKSTIAMEQKKQELQSSVMALQDTAASVVLPNGELPPSGGNVNESIAEYYELKHDIETLGKECRALITLEEHISPFLVPGRIVELSEEATNTYWGWGICCSAVKIRSAVNKRNASSIAIRTCIVDCLVECASDSVTSINEMGTVRTPKPSNGQSKSRWEILPFQIQCILSLSQLRVLLPNNRDFSAQEAKESMKYQLEKIIGSCGGKDKIPLFDPIRHMNIKEPRLAEIISEIKEKERKLAENPFFNYKHLNLYYQKYHEYTKLLTQLRVYEDKLQKARHMVMKDDLRSMRRVLRKLDYLDRNGVVTLKGRVACEISAADELIAAELLLQNFFYDVECNYIVAILSCLVFDEKNDEANPTDRKLIAGYDKIKDIAKRVGEVSIESKLPLLLEDYLDKYKSNLMQITLKWMNGESFVNAMKDSTLFEGSVIRSLRRLEELLRQLACACKEMGDLQLEKKFLEGMSTLKRGIVFSPSLFL